MTNLYLSFNAVSNDTLITIYRASYSNTLQEYFSLSDISSLSQLGIGTVFLKKVLASLHVEDLLSTFSGEDGEQYYTLTIKGWTSAEGLAQALLKGGEPHDGVPASDRVVTLTDNQQTALADGLSDITTAIVQSNEAGDALGDQKERIVAEVEAGKKLLGVRKVRLEALLGVLATPLRFLVEKFSGAGIGELAKKLLDELWKAISS